MDRLRLAEVNAGERHRVRFRRTGGDEAIAVERLARAIGLAIPPQRIEAFDISHLQGTDSVASLVVFEEGRPKKSDYRLFNIASQQLLEPDDFRSMAEAVERRYRRVHGENGKLPDLILVDGGRGQLQAALTALDRVGIELPVVGLAKREEEIWAPGRPEPIRLSRKDPALQLIQRVRDEAHRFAISRHRNRRGKRMRQTGLTEIPGVGPVRARLLLRRFGSVRGLQVADPREIEAAVGPMTARRGGRVPRPPERSRRMRTAFEAEGEIRGTDLLAALVALWRESANGTLQFSRSGATSGFELAAGEIVGTSSSDPRFETAAILLRAGKLDEATLERLKAVEGTDRAQSALQAGVLTRREWRWGEKIRAVEILSDLLTWLDGEYWLFRTGAREAGEFRLSIPRLVLELFLRSRGPRPGSPLPRGRRCPAEPGRALRSGVLDLRPDAGR